MKSRSSYKEELDHDALLGPFEQIPHPAFTWSPLMTRPKGMGRRIILDLSYGDYSLNKSTNRECFDGKPFTLKTTVTGPLKHQTLKNMARMPGYI